MVWWAVRFRGALYITSFLSSNACNVENAPSATIHSGNSTQHACQDNCRRTGDPARRFPEGYAQSCRPSLNRARLSQPRCLVLAETNSPRQRPTRCHTRHLRGRCLGAPTGDDSHVVIEKDLISRRWRMREAGSAITPSAFIRSIATRQLMSLSRPSALRQSSISHTRRESCERFNSGMLDIKCTMAASSSALKSRPQ